MSLILLDAFAGVTPVSVAVAGTASKQVAAIAADVVAPPDPVTVAIAGMASAQVTSIRSGYPHHVAPAARLFAWKV